MVGYSELLDFAKKMALVSGQMMLKAKQQGQLDIQKKQDGSFVTKVDLAIDHYLRREIGKYYPDHNLITEESGMIKNSDSDYCWVLDPIDGTHNYMSGLGMFAVAIGVMVENKPVIGVIYDPTADNLYSAVHGGGAWLNDQVLCCDLTKVNKQFGMVGFSYKNRFSNAINGLTDIDWIPHVRCLGSSAIGCMLVASNILEVYHDTKNHIWDVVAAYVILTEAGSVVRILPEHMTDKHFLGHFDILCCGSERTRHLELAV